MAARHHRRATRFITAVAEPGTVAEPLTKEDLVDYIRSGCKPKEEWRYVRGRHRSATHDVASGFSALLRGAFSPGVPSREFSETRPSRPFPSQHPIFSS